MVKYAVWDQIQSQSRRRMTVAVTFVVLYYYDIYWFSEPHNTVIVPLPMKVFCHLYILYVSFGCLRPDITVMVDWALRINYLSILQMPELQEALVQRDKIIRQLTTHLQETMASRSSSTRDDRPDYTQEMQHLSQQVVLLHEQLTQVRMMVQCLVVQFLSFSYPPPSPSLSLSLSFCLSFPFSLSSFLGVEEYLSFA